MDPGKLVEIFIMAAATLAAAYCGARAAFAFNREHEEGRERRQQIEECNRALLVLVRQYNQLINFREQFLDPMRDHPARHILIPPSDHPDYSTWTVNVPALAFLMQTDAAELPFMLALADQRFHSAIAAMRTRSKLHHDFQEALAKSAQGDEEWPLAQIHEAIGQRLTVLLTQATDALVLIVDEALLSHERIGKDAKPVLRTLYKGARIISFGPDPSRERKIGAVPPPQSRSSPI